MAIAPTCGSAHGTTEPTARNFDAVATPHSPASRSQAAGGDRRGQQSAALLVVERDGGYAGLSDVVVDLRVEDHALPLQELRRLYGLHQMLFGETPREEWVDVDEALADELRERLARLGYEGELESAFNRWAGNVNLEERVDGVEAVDPVVLEELRSMS